MTDLSPEEIAALRTEHKKTWNLNWTHCPLCQKDWPCPAVRALDTLEFWKKAAHDYLNTLEELQQELDQEQINTSANERGWEEQVQRLQKVVAVVKEGCSFMTIEQADRARAAIATLREHTEAEIDTNN